MNIPGTNGHDKLKGTDGADTMQGLGGIDTLVGSAGADVLDGGAESDRVDYTLSKAGVSVALLDPDLTGVGGDAEGDRFISIENISGSGFNDFLIGDDGANIIDGGGGQDVIKGLGGDDRLEGRGTLDGGDGRDDLRGSYSDDILVGGNGDDRLDGRGGADKLDGGLGTDVATYDTSNEGVIIDLAGGAGFGGDAEGDTFTGVEDVSGSRHEDLIVGDGGSNVLKGRDGDDTLKGGGGADRLEGGFGTDALAGGLGDDTLIGGDDSDTLNGGEGVDTADYASSNAGVSVDLGANTGTGGEAQGDTYFDVENVEGSTFGDKLIGDDAANVLGGGDGADTLKGGGGADTLLGDLGNDTLLGNAGADTLDGGSGADNMAGGADNDTYVIDNLEDFVNEFLGGSGSDTVVSRIGFNLSGTQVSGDVENLTLTGSGNINAFGNALANSLVGNSGRNVLDGSAGADRMAGMGGDDTYVIRDAGDIVDESLIGSGGVDEVRTFISTSLAGPNVLGQVENMRLLGSSAINAAGNGLGNVLTGNSGNNDLLGLGGNDTLTGGLGADTFVFSASLNALTNVDTITDFSALFDTIRLENAFFPALTTAGTLAQSAFHIGAGAHDADDRVIYNNASGVLSYDADGAGSAGAVQFAILDPGLPITSADFLVV